MSASPADPLTSKLVAPGTVIDGKYRVERTLGQGGMGVVVAAKHVTLKHRVAIKVLLSDLHDKDSVARFLREAQVLALLKSPHVARVLDVGALEGGAPYLVMEHLAGRDYAQVLAEDGPLAVADACNAVVQACHGLAEAHAHGIVHRDLKPGNLFLTTATDGSPLVKVLDFGISKRRSVDGALTATRALLGSPLYMSPEQVKSSRSVDHRTDIWSLGVVLFQLLSCTRPFDGENIGEMFAAILEAHPPDLRALRPELPESLVAIVGKCLQRDRALRYQSVGELSGALAEFGDEAARSLAEKTGRMSASFDDTLRAESSPTRATPNGGSEPAVITATAWQGAGWRTSLQEASGTKRIAFGLMAVIPIVTFATFYFVAGSPNRPAARSTAPVETAAPSSAASAAPVESPRPTVEPETPPAPIASAAASAIASATASTKSPVRAPTKSSGARRPGPPRSTPSASKPPSTESILERD